MRKLAYFVALSMIAHIALVSGLSFELSRRDNTPPPLQARLLPAEPVRPEPASPRAKTQPRKTKSTPQPVVAAPQIAAAPRSDPAPLLDAAPLPDAEPVQRSQTQPATVPAPVPATEQPAIVADPERAPAAAPAPAPLRRLPRKGEITYVLYLGNDKFSVGATYQAWEIHDDSYRLTSVSETTGLVALFRRERRSYESVGRLTAAGLRPEFFANQRVRSGRSENARASFDWDAKTIKLGRTQEQRTMALPADAQDLMSFMYQLGSRPLAPGRIEVPITNGWKLERYQLDVGAEELLQTPFGVLRALPIKQVREAGQESIELWLATEYRLLPVRIRFFDREGEPAGEQSVSDIRVSED